MTKVPDYIASDEPIELIANGRRFYPCFRDEALTGGMSKREALRWMRGTMEARRDFREGEARRKAAADLEALRADEARKERLRLRAIEAGRQLNLF